MPNSARSLQPLSSALFEAVNSGVSATSARGKDNNRASSGIFLDPARIKQQVRAALEKPPYTVTDYYWESGICRTIATSPAFEKVTLFVIALNALWIAIDTDWNEASVIVEAQFFFQLAENCFCAFFVGELLVRFAAFKRKRNCLLDAWFVFDSVLVLLVILETWMFTFFLLITGYEADTGSLASTSVLRMARVLRLARMARMARLLRAVPELMVLVKGLMAAARSVFFSLCLLLGLIFVFSIGFTQLTDELPIHKSFDHVLLSMYTLLFRGALLDNSYYLANEIGDSSLPLAGLFVIFVLMSAVTLMNMLIGVLVEVVSSVAALEYEQSAMIWVRSKIAPLVGELDEDGNERISREEFIKLLQKPVAVNTLHDIGVDPVGLVDYADFIFSDDVTGVERDDLTFTEFMEVVLQLRGSNVATVKDIVDLRKFITQIFLHFESKLDLLFSKRLHDGILNSGLLAEFGLNSSGLADSDEIADSTRRTHAKHSVERIRSTRMTRKSRDALLPGRRSVQEMQEKRRLTADRMSAISVMSAISEHKQLPKASIVTTDDMEICESASMSITARDSPKSTKSTRLAAEVAQGSLVMTEDIHGCESATMSITARDSLKSTKSTRSPRGTTKSGALLSPNADTGSRKDKEEQMPKPPDCLDSLDVTQAGNVVQLVKKELGELQLFTAASAASMADELAKSLEDQFHNLEALPAPPVSPPAKAVQGASRGLQTSRIQCLRLPEEHSSNLKDTCAQTVASPAEPPGAAQAMNASPDDHNLHDLHKSRLKSPEPGSSNGAVVPETVL